MANSAMAGVITGVRWYNEESGWTVASVQPFEGFNPNGGSSVTVVGIMPKLYEGQEVEYTGTWVEDKRYGQQFKTETCNAKAPANGDALKAYLASGNFYGIGPKLAERIVDQFGEGTRQVLDNGNYDALSTVKGISEEKAIDICETWARDGEEREALMFLAGLGLSMTIARRIYNTYGADTIGKVKENPYLLSYDVDGIGFFKADKIARSMGIPYDSPFRYDAGLLHVMNQAASNDGHCYVEIDTLAELAGELLTNEEEDSAFLFADLIGRVYSLERDGRLLVDDGKDKEELVYLPQLYYAEERVASGLVNINEHPVSTMLVMDQNLATQIDRWLEENEAKLNEEQLGAVFAAFNHKISILTGGPGTGKSHTLRTLIDAVLRAGKTFRLAAPTGRAAKRMAEATGREASTIHRLLEYSPGDGFRRNASYPLDCDIVVIDEASMIDIFLMHSLVKALRPEMVLMLIGDVDQLPSVGPGNVLNDVIASGIAHVTRLTHIYRQTEGSVIASNAAAINEGRMPNLSNETDDTWHFEIQNEEVAAAEIVRLMQHKLPAKLGIDPINDAQVLSPMYKGPLGVDALNTRLQEALNPPALTKQELKTKFRHFREGDKVMQTKNNYDSMAFNGDIGRIVRINHQDKEMTITFDDGNFVVYDFNDLNQIVLAYACTVHKSQGAEWPVVVMPVHTQHYIMLKRRLIYTGVTRAKKACITVGTRQAMGVAVRNNDDSRRNTLLEVRLKGEA